MKYCIVGSIEEYIIVNTVILDYIQYCICKYVCNRSHQLQEAIKT